MLFNPSQRFLGSLVLFLGLSHFILAQTPTQTWTQAANCTAGLPTPSSLNGTYLDHYGATYAVQCAQDSTGFSYDQFEGTNGQGPYACFKGCDSRPGCTGFMFTGTSSGPTTGAGRCYYKSQIGTYYSNSSVYAAANLISNGSPYLACPYYNNTIFQLSDGTYWQVYCGFDLTAVAASTQQGTTGSVTSCMQQCNAISDCTMFSYTYTGSEPADGATNVQGTCYFKKGTYQVYGYGTLTVNAALRVPAPTSTSLATLLSSTSSTTTSSSNPAVVTTTISTSSILATTTASTSIASTSSAAITTTTVITAASSSSLASSTSSTSILATSSAAGLGLGATVVSIPLTTSSTIQVLPSVTSSLALAVTTSSLQIVSSMTSSLALAVTTSSLQIVPSMTSSLALAVTTSSLQIVPSMTSSLALSVTSSTLQIVPSMTSSLALAVTSSSLQVLPTSSLAVVASSSSLQLVPSISSSSLQLVPSITTSSLQVATLVSSSVTLSSSSLAVLQLASTSTAPQINSASASIGTPSASLAVTTISASPGAPSAACTSAPLPYNPVCPQANLTSFLDSCGTNYTVYCGFDSNPGAVSTQSASSLLQCMQLCDNYSGCQAATYAPGSPGTCYLKTSFQAVFANAGVQSVIRYIPPNPLYSAPIPSTNSNASSGCGLTLPAGLTPNGNSVLFNFINPSDGLQRNYTIHIPQYYDPNKASPVIFAFPGNGEAASNIEQETGLSSATLNPYAIAVYVNGYGLGFTSNPNWGVPGSKYSFVDDLGFMKNLISNITASFCVDTSRLWATGHSNGGGFVNVMACDPVLSGLISVFTANSAAAYTGATSGDPNTLEPVNTPVQSICSPSRPVPFLEIHGTSDGTINYYGGPRNGRILPSIPHLLTDWAIRDGLSPNNLTTALSSAVTQYQFGNGANLGLITQLTLAGWIHAWPTIATGAPIDGGPAIMNFFYTFANASRVISNATISTSLSTMPTTISNTMSLSVTSVSMSLPTTSLPLTLNNTTLSMTSTSIGVTLSNTTILTAPVTISSTTLPVSAAASLSAGGLGLPGTVPTQVAASASLAASLSIAATTSLMANALNATISAPSTMLNATVSQYPSALNVTASQLSTTLGVTTTQLATSLGLTVSQPSTTIAVSVTSKAISISVPTTLSSSISISFPTTLPSPISISNLAISIVAPTTSVGSFSLSLPSSSLSLFSTSLGFSSTSLGLASTSISIQAASITALAPSYTGSAPSTSLGLPTTTISFSSLAILSNSVSISSVALPSTISFSSPVAPSNTISISSPAVPSTLSISSLVILTNTISISTPVNTISVSSPAIPSSISFSTPVAPSTSISLFTTSLSISSLSLPSTSPGPYSVTSTSLAIPSVSLISTSISQPGYSVSSISVTLSSTSIGLPSSYVSILSTSVSVSSLSSLVLQTPAISTGLTSPVLSYSSLISNMPSTTPGISSTTISASVSVVSAPSSVTSVALNTQAPSFSCPYNNGSIVYDQNMVPYQIQCGMDTYGSNSGVLSASTSFNDCFYQCDMTPSCAGFTYEGGQNGTGSGLCFLKGGSVGFVSGSFNVVAVVRYVGPYMPSYAPTFSTSVGTGLSTSTAVQTPTVMTSSSVQISTPSTSLSVSVMGASLVSITSGISTPGLILLSATTNALLSTPGLILPSVSSTVTPSLPAFGSLTTIPQLSTSTQISLSLTSVSLPTPSSAFTSASTPSVSLVSTDISVAFGSTVVNPPSISSISVSLQSTSVMISTSITSLSVSLTSPDTPSFSTTISIPTISSISLDMYSSTQTTISSTQATDSSSSSTDSGESSSSTVTSTQSDFSLPPITSLMALSSTTIQVSSVSVATPCPTNACGVQVTNQTCSDPYGNNFHVSCGLSFSGAVSVRVTKTNVNACLTACDTYQGCVAMNFDQSNGNCELLSSVNGTTTKPGAAAATRPVNVATTYTMPPTSTSMAMMSTSPGNLGYGSVSSTSSSAIEGMPPSYGPLSSSMLVMPTSSMGSASTTMAGPGGMYGSSTASQSSSMTVSPPSTYTGPLCPSFNKMNYTDARSNTYAVACNSAYTGTVIAGAYRALARQYGAVTVQTCIAECDQVDACIAITYSTNQCTLYSSTTGQNSAYGSTSLYRVKRIPANVSVVTVSTCAATAQYTRTRFTTINQTTTMTCSSPATCAAKPRPYMRGVQEA